jgi:hypothetical protein
MRMQFSSCQRSATPLLQNGECIIVIGAVITISSVLLNDSNSYYKLFFTMNG